MAFLFFLSFVFQKLFQYQDTPTYKRFVHVAEEAYVFLFFMFSIMFVLNYLPRTAANSNITLWNWYKKKQLQTSVRLYLITSNHLVLV